MVKLRMCYVNIPFYCSFTVSICSTDEIVLKIKDNVIQNAKHIKKKGNLLQLMINYGRGKRTGKENCFNFNGMVRLRHNYKL